MSTSRPLGNNPSLRAINHQPRQIEVTTLDQMPAFVNRKGKTWPSSTFRDQWRIDDRWWTEAPVSRMYYELELPDAQVTTDYHDMVEDLWYELKVESLRRAPSDRP